MGAKVLVTGGAGFIGSYLVERLMRESYDVVVVDNLHRGLKENLGVIFDEIEFLSEDICNESVMNDLIERSDVVYHLAAMSRVMSSIDDPELCFRYNVIGTEIISRLCVKFNKKLIFASSREVYGSAEYLPVDINHPIKPENPYAASKISGEMIIRSYSNIYGLKYLILRLSNVYGEGDIGRVIPIFIEKARNGDDLIIFGNNKIMDFVFISDVVEGFIKCLDYNKNETFNIGSGIPTTLKKLAENIINITHSCSNIKTIQSRNGEVDKYTAEISRTKKELNWIPTYNLRSGLSEMIV